MEVVPKQVWEETVSPGRKRQFIVLRVSEAEVQVLENDSSSKTPIRTINLHDLIGEPKKYRLIADA
jgi:hypothetical protein